jgi:hypothetical protein
MSKKWNQTVIQQYIDDEIQESLTLEYKAADALGKSDGKKKEITKDVSAMANAAGGIIIYGVKEYDERDKRHLPEKIDEIDRTQFSKEWLEQVINNIRPRLDGLAICPVSISSGPKNVVYVVDVPQSTTAHQATDHRYYKRYNFQSVPMEDHEVRDVMNRATTPNPQIEFRASTWSERFPDGMMRGHYNLRITIKNQGVRVINNFKLMLITPEVGWVEGESLIIAPHFDFKSADEKKENITYSHLANRDGSVDLLIVYRAKELLFPEDQFDIGSEIGWKIHQDRKPDEPTADWHRILSEERLLKWTLYADDMPPKQGEFLIHELAGF